MEKETPCDFYPFECPYNAYRWSDCEYWCKVGVPDEEPDIFDDFDIVEVEYITEEQDS